ncbi:PfkB family carbohydrate kinase [Mesorhizobium calcicola]|uniref:PfkB family carbohydrate kinase n=1 Tax=Mesorhizobium calcicola TaxID=1300310 RepID=A0ABW4WEK8_9HYPH
MLRSEEVYVVGSYGVAFWIVGEVPAPGETLLGSGFAFGNGGKGSNQAIGAARLGARCSLLAGVGADKFGLEALELWRVEGVDCSAVRQTSETPTMAGIIILDTAGENRIITDPGANARLTTTDVEPSQPPGRARASYSHSSRSQSRRRPARLPSARRGD